MHAPRRWQGWFVADVLGPFALSRALLLVVGWYASQFAPSWNYFLPRAATRGWTYLPTFALDVWAKYDTAWYLDLAWNGYRLPAEPGWQSNLAFFPLFPLLTRGAYALVPAGWQGQPALYLCGLAVANVAAIGSLALVHAWVRAEVPGPDGPRLARRVVLLALAFPAGFFLSCAYSESLFLLASAASLWALARGRPLAAGAAGLAAALTRPTGVLLAVPIALAAICARGARGPAKADPAETRASAPPGAPPAQSAAAPHAGRAALLAALLPPLGLLLHAANLWRVSGEPLAFLHVQAAWGRGLSPPWELLFSRAGTHPFTAPLDRAAVLLFVGLGVALLVREKRAALGAYVLLSLLPIVLSGTAMSATRLVAVLFPALLPLARIAGGERAGPALFATFAALQALLFAAWSRFHWVA